MTDLGIVIACIYKDGYAFLADDNEVTMCFESHEAAGKFINDEIEDKSGLFLLYRTYCIKCGKKYFLTESQFRPEDMGHYLCHTNIKCECQTKTK